MKTHIHSGSNVSLCGMDLQGRYFAPKDSDASCKRCQAMAEREAPQYSGVGLMKSYPPIKERQRSWWKRLFGR